jgi:predicted dehydrogenase
MLGRVLQVRLHGGYSLDEAATWHLNQPDDIGGAFFVIGCHLIDLLIHHLGMPDSANAKIPKFGGLFGPGSREDAGIVVFENSNKIVSFDFSSWDPLPWVESWEISFYGDEGVLDARPLPATCELFLKEAEAASMRAGLGGTRPRFRSPGRRRRLSTLLIWPRLVTCISFVGKWRVSLLQHWANGQSKFPLLMPATF